MPEHGQPGGEVFSAAEAACEQVIERFEDAWRHGQQPAIGDFLPPDAADRPSVLVELVHVDLEYRLKAGYATRVESYLSRYPELADDHSAVVGLIAAEYEQRRRRQPEVAAGEYCRRFPQYGDLLPAVLRVDQAESAAEDASAASPTPRSTPAAAALAGVTPVSEPAGSDPFSTQATLSPAQPVPTAVLDLGTIPGYEILSELGRGGMGIVYKARQIKLKRLVALKMILSGAHAGPQEVARFCREAETVARLQHPNVVQVYEVGEQYGRSYLVLELIEGESLDRKLAGTPQPAHMAAQLVEVLARAMHVAHQQGIIHRDLKPANVLLTADGTPKITDFGLARKLGETPHTRSGAILGTPSYMAPEQARGKNKEVGPAADIYALGAILYELLTGRPPFKAVIPLDTVLQVISEDPVPPRMLQPGTPRDLQTICLKCLQKESRRRYVTADELAADLRRFLQGQPIRARSVGKAERLWRWCRRNPAVAGLTAAVFAILLAVAIAGLLTAGKYRAMAERETQARADAEQAFQHEKQVKEDAEAAGTKAVEALQHEKQAKEDAEAARTKAVLVFQMLNNRPDVAVSPVVLYNTVLEPGVRLGEELILTRNDAELKKAVASFYAAIGEVIQKDPYAPWPFPNPSQKVFEAYQRACELDDHQARYLVGRAYAAMDLGKMRSLDELESDANKAIALDKKYAGAYGLRGRLLHLRSRSEADFNKRIVELRRAGADYDTALLLCKNGDEKSVILINQSTANLELGNLVESGQRKGYLDKARSDAEKAIELLKDQPDEFACLALGNALEELSSLPGESEQYAPAIEKFTRAIIATRSRRAAPFIARGRSSYKWVAGGKGRPKLLDDALSDLSDAFAASSTPAEKAEIYYWRAKIAAFQEDGAKADKDYQEAVKLAKKDESPSQHAAYALDWARFVLDDGIASRKSPAKTRERVEGILADGTFRDPAKLEAALLRGHAYQFEGKRQKAYDIFSQALPDELREAKVVHLSLLLARADCVLEKPEDFGDLKPSAAVIAWQDSERALELVKDPSIDAQTKAHALGTNGVAHFFAADAEPGKKNWHVQRCVERLREAIKCSANHPRGYTWRYTLAWQLIKLMSRESGAKWSQHRDEAVSLLKEAEALVPPGPEMEDIHNSRLALEKLKPPE
jgi:tRNA A-37 threonylcarbamoyl transferase component Bud32/tetratricopeptide (TPR) repeat protein